MSKKVTEVAEKLHTLLVEALLEKIQDGTATAAELNVARQFLKDNGVDYLMIRDETPLRKLTDALPFASPSKADLG